ncbi:MAG: hypothetical protein KKG99_07360 [Bacteroidetes bacterium]|nr:hypothetical protein [Bacteroidota bacterium]
MNLQILMKLIHLKNKILNIKLLDMESFHTKRGKVFQASDLSNTKRMKLPTAEQRGINWISI